MVGVVGGDEEVMGWGWGVIRGAIKCERVCVGWAMKCEHVCVCVEGDVPRRRGTCQGP